MLKIIGFFLILCFVILFFMKPKRGIKKIKKQKSDIDIFNKLVLKKKRTYKEILDLANFYHRGISDIIDNEGKTIKGIKPDFIKAVRYYEKLDKSRFSYVSYSELANIYHYGYVGFENIVDLNLAREYYLKMLFCPIQDLKTQSIERIIQLNELQNFPSHTGLNNMTEPTFFFNIEEEEAYNTPVIEQVRNDTQNVHDPVVVKSVKNSFKELEKNTKTILNNGHEKLSEIIRKSKPSFSGDSKAHSSRISKSIKLLNSMVSRNSDISSLNMDEKGIINLVYSKYTQLDEKEKENFVHNVVLQLSDGIEFGNSVCAQGRAERLLSSLPDFEIKPLWAIKQEMMNKAPLIRERLLAKHNKVEKEWIEAPSNKEQQDYSDFFDQKMKTTMKAEFIKDYVDKGLIELSSLEQEIDSWI